MTEAEIYETHAELHNVRADLANLHTWAENALNAEHDRQLIAEYLSDAMYALGCGLALPRRPF